MMVDLIPGNMREQGFPILRMFTVPGKLIVFAIGYPLLKLHLSNYTTFWAVSLSTDFVCLFFFIFFLPESMPDKMKQPVSKMDLFPGSYYWRAAKIVSKYCELQHKCQLFWEFSVENAEIMENSPAK